MKVLGKGEARGGVSILHALGTGKGCSIGVNLLTRVELIDKKYENSQDEHNLLKSVIECWKEAGFPVPKEYGWKIMSEIPIGQGLKSSSALACAAIKSLDSASWTKLNNYEIIDLAVKAQKKSGCTITGSIDDSWSSITEGWKLIDSTKMASESIISEGHIEESLSVLIGTRESRISKINIHSFDGYQTLFSRALQLIEKGDVLEAMTANGIGVAAANDDDEAIKICNLAIASGAIAAGISGSGPAISIICYENEIEIMSEIINRFEMGLIRTTFHNEIKGE